jgi:hypothetical protein
MPERDLPNSAERRTFVSLREPRAWRDDPVKTAFSAMLATALATGCFASPLQAGQDRPHRQAAANEITVHGHAPQAAQPAYVPADPNGVPPSEWLTLRRRPTPPGYFGPCGYWNDCGWMPGQILGGLAEAARSAGR